MATIETGLLEIRLSNVPLINVREDFNVMLALFRSERFRRQFTGHKGKVIPIKTHVFTWRGMPEVLLSHILRESIVGLESAVSGAVFMESLLRGMASDKIREATKNPFSLGKSTANCVFNRLPSLIERSWALRLSNVELWGRTSEFYKRVRNPLFHAYQFASRDPEPVWKALEFLWELFQWINTWHPPERLAYGPIRWAIDPRKRFGEIPEIDDRRLEQMILERRLPARPKGKKSDSGTSGPLGIEDVKGMYIGTEPMVELNLEDSKEGDVELRLSAYAAMKLLRCLALAQDQRGWEIPDLDD